MRRRRARGAGLTASDARPTRVIPAMTIDPALVEAAELLASQGRRRDAIALVERALRERRDADTMVLLASLLLGAGSVREQNLAFAHLRRLQWLAPPPSVRVGGRRGAGSRS